VTLRSDLKIWVFNQVHTVTRKLSGVFVCVFVRRFSQPFKYLSFYLYDCFHGPRAFPTPVGGQLYYSADIKRWGGCSLPGHGLRRRCPSRLGAPPPRKCPHGRTTARRASATLLRVVFDTNVVIATCAGGYPLPVS
jgi:hypothetical protein